MADADGPTFMTGQLARLVERERLDCFTEEYRDKVGDDQVLGVLISQFFQWDGAAIMRTLCYALEDANFHSVNRRLVETFPDLTQGANV